jgi:hypothetical protein
MTGLQTFDLARLNLITIPDFELPNNLRLGHLAEVVVSELIKASTNYNVLYENVQLVEDNKTIGEIDFILEDAHTKQLLHMELAYKFYLYDPNISSEPINNWIGPNRNDSLIKKLEKVKNKQFPLLFRNSAKLMIKKIDVGEVSQALCCLVSLYIPYGYSASFSPEYEPAIKGYYLNFEKFIDFNHSEKYYYIPPKLEWGIDPADNENWTDFNGIEKYINTCMKEKQALLCWQKYGGIYLSFFIVWW